MYRYTSTDAAFLRSKVTANDLMEVRKVKAIDVSIRVIYNLCYFITRNNNSFDPSSLKRCRFKIKTFIFMFTWICNIIYDVFVNWSTG